jgi:hypothetical protein
MLNLPYEETTARSRAVCNLDRSSTTLSESGRIAIHDVVAQDLAQTKQEELSQAVCECC